MPEPNKSQIIEKAIRKAIENGWQPIVNGEFLEISNNKFTGEPHLAHKAAWNNKRWALGQSVASVLLDHNFAKILWGKTSVRSDNGIPQDYTVFADFLSYEPNWQYHLQQMVISEDPIAYLAENI